MLSIKETAIHFSVSEKTIRRRIADGNIYAIFFGKQYRIPHDEIKRIESSGIYIAPDSIFASTQKNTHRMRKKGRKPWES